MVVKPEQERVRNLLTDTVTLLCKNGLTYNKEMKVQGLLGITLDEEEVFVVHIDERFCDLLAGRAMEELSQRPETPVEKEQESKSHKKRKRRRSSKDSDGESPSDSSQPAKRNLDSTSQDSFDNIRVKQEKTDVVCIDDDSGGNVNIKPDPASFQNYGLSQQTPMTSQGFAGRTLGAQMSDNSNTSWDGSQLPQLQTYQGGGSSANPAASSWNPGNNLPSTDNTTVTAGQMLRRTPSQHGGDLSTFAPPASPLSSKNYHFSSGASRHRRPVTSEEKQYVCQYPGCGRAYFQKCSLQFHQTQKHGRKKTCERKRKSEMNDAIDSDMMKAVLLASRANPDDYKQQLASALHSLSKKVSPDNVGAGESFSQEHVLPDSDLRNNQSQQLDQSVLSPRSSIEKSHEIPDYKQQLNEALMSLSPTSPSKALYSGMEAENNKSGFRSPQGDQLAYEQDSFRSPMNPPQHTSYDSLSEQTAFSQTQLSVNAEGPLSPNVFRPPVHSPAYSQAPPNLLPQYSSVDSMPAHSLATQSPAVSLDPDSLPGSQQSFHTSPYSSTAMPRQYDSKDDPDQQEYRDFGGAVFPTSSSGSFMGSSN